jgi:hypothetical protein
MRGYVVAKGDRFYAVIYEGIDPITGRERRRWHPAGTDRDEAERLAIVRAAEANQNAKGAGLSVGRYLLHTWLPAKRINLRPSTWHGYARNVELHIVPRVGRIPLRRLRAHQSRRSVRRSPRQRPQRRQGRPRAQDRPRSACDRAQGARRCVPARACPPQRRL